MLLRTPLLLGIVIGFMGSVSLSGPVAAETQNIKSTEKLALPIKQVQSVWAGLAPSQRKMVDLLAADFFMSELSAEQRSRISAANARKYREASPALREEMRLQRRLAWQNMSEQEKQDFYQGANSYDLLSDAQKAPFRLYAISQLDLKAPEGQKSSSRRSAI
jgi:hypothetical protein